MLGLSHKFVIETELFCEVKRTRLSSIESQPKKAVVVVVGVVGVVSVSLAPTPTCQPSLTPAQLPAWAKAATVFVFCLSVF